MSIVIVTGRGGAGKTTTTANLSAYLAIRDFRVLAIDGDLYLPNLGFHFMLENVRYTVHSVIKDSELDPHWAIYRHKETGVYVMPGSTNLHDVLGVSPRRLVDLIERVRPHFGMIIVDSPTGIPFDTLPTFEIADHQIIVAELERSPIYSLHKMIKNEIKKLKAIGEKYGLEIGVILNKVRESEEVVEEVIDFIEKELSVTVLGWIPFDPKVPEAVNAGIPVIKYFPESDAAIAFKETGEVFVRWLIR